MHVIARCVRWQVNFWSSFEPTSTADSVRRNWKELLTDNNNKGRAVQGLYPPSFITVIWSGREWLKNASVLTVKSDLWGISHLPGCYEKHLGLNIKDKKEENNIILSCSYLNTIKAATETSETWQAVLYGSWNAHRLKCFTALVYEECLDVYGDNLLLSQVVIPHPLFRN